MQIPDLKKDRSGIRGSTQRLRRHSQLVAEPNGDEKVGGKVICPGGL